MKAPNRFTGSVRLVDRKTQVVEVLGPRLDHSRSLPRLVQSGCTSLAAAVSRSAPNPVDSV